MQIRFLPLTLAKKENKQKEHFCRMFKSIWFSNNGLTIPIRQYENQKTFITEFFEQITL